MQPFLAFGQASIGHLRLLLLNCLNPTDQDFT